MLYKKMKARAEGGGDSAVMVPTANVEQAGRPALEKVFKVAYEEACYMNASQGFDDGCKAEMVLAVVEYFKQEPQRGVGGG